MIALYVFSFATVISVLAFVVVVVVDCLIFLFWFENLRCCGVGIYNFMLSVVVSGCSNVCCSGVDVVLLRLMFVNFCLFHVDECMYPLNEFLVCFNYLILFHYNRPCTLP